MLSMNCRKAGRVTRLSQRRAPCVPFKLGAVVASLGSAVGVPGTFGQSCKHDWTPQPGVFLFAGVHDDGSGPALFAQGPNVFAPPQSSTSVLKLSAGTWQQIAVLTMSTGSNDVGAIAFRSHDDGSGRALYVGGEFGTVSGFPIVSLARWRGGEWSQVGAGLVGGLGYLPTVVDLVEFDDGSGPALYIGGWLTLKSPGATFGIARWDGSVLSGVGQGVSMSLTDMEVYDPGSGPALYVAGYLGTSLALVRWDGRAWTVVGSFTGPGGEPGVPRSLAVYDRGEGPELYVAGCFNQVNGLPSQALARWNGASWAGFSLGWGNGCIVTIRVFDDGRGPALYAGGGFSVIGGVPVDRIGRWDGRSWSSLGWGPQIATVAMTEFDDGSGPALWVGGIFPPFPPATVGLAKYQYVCDPCYPDCDGSGTLSLADFGCFQTRFVAADPEADCNASGTLTIADFGCFQTKFVAGCP